MFSVIFEVLPKPGKKEEYLGLARQLRPVIESINGFIDNERFESTSRPGWVLSHSTWRDEKSVIRWRTERRHHETQEKGRFDVFEDYHLRVGEVIGDTDPPVKLIEQRFDETEVGVAKLATLTEVMPVRDAGSALEPNALPAALGVDLADRAIAEYDVFTSIYNPGKLALLVGWCNEDAAGWTPREINGGKKLRHRRIRIVRDYGRFDRREAPQFYPDVEGTPTRHAQPVG